MGLAVGLLNWEGSVSAGGAPGSWHGDLGECLRLAQCVNLDMSEGLAHRALQVPLPLLLCLPELVDDEG